MGVRTKRWSVLVGVVAVLVAGGGYGWHLQHASPTERLPRTAPALPSRLYQPDPFLPGTAESGPPGPLAAAWEAPRGHLRVTARGPFRDRGVVGVSATTGAYVFLDLPNGASRANPDYGQIDLVQSMPASGFRLSPDGSRLAYWVSRAHPGPSPGPEQGDGRVSTELAVYDTRTGAVDRLRLPDVMDRLGMPSELTWLDADRLAYAVPTPASTKDSSAKPTTAVHVWRVGSASDTTRPDLTNVGTLVSGKGGGLPLRLDQGIDHDELTLAGDLVGRPTVRRPAPPDVPDRRLDKVIAGAVAALVLLVAGTVGLGVLTRRSRGRRIAADFREGQRLRSGTGS